MFINKQISSFLFIVKYGCDKCLFVNGVNEVKRILLMTALATILLSACNNNNVKEEVSKNKEENVKAVQT